MERFRSRSSQDGSKRRAPASGVAGSRARLATRLLLLVALAVSSLALTQCRMVGDSLTGVRVDSFKRKSDCTRACKDAYKDDRKAEQDLYASNISACRGDAACKAQERARHDAAMAAIEAAYLACLNACHNQGGGTIGP